MVSLILYGWAEKNLFDFESFFFTKNLFDFECYFFCRRVPFPWAASPGKPLKCVVFLKKMGRDIEKAKVF